MPTFPIRLVLPTTCSFVWGAVVPIPTLVSAVALLMLWIEPSTIELSCVTCAFAPIAVELLPPVPVLPTLAPAPMAVELEIGMDGIPIRSMVAFSPMTVLLLLPTEPFWARKSAEWPMNMLLLPPLVKPALLPTDVLLLPSPLALAPISVLSFPVTLKPASEPKKEFLAPLLLLKPALSPKKELKLPVLLKPA